MSILLTILALLASTTGQASTELPTCQTETSANCFWDASTQGNKVGKSYHDIDGIAYFACDGFEDSANCYWDATQQGNGQGRSFTDVGGVAHYWDTIS